MTFLLLFIEACDVMQCVANHINEMQKLSAEFGESFRSLSAQVISQNS